MHKVADNHSMVRTVYSVVNNNNNIERNVSPSRCPGVHARKFLWLFFSFLNFEYTLFGAINQQ